MKANYYNIVFENKEGNIEEFFSHDMPYKKDEKIGILKNGKFNEYKIQKIYHELRIGEFDIIKYVFIKLKIRKNQGEKV